MICPCAAPVRGSASGMQETVRRPAGRTRASDPIFVGCFIPRAIHDLAAVVTRGSRRGALRLMISPLLDGRKLPAAVRAAKVVCCWIHCRHSPCSRGSAALLVLVLRPCARRFEVTFPLVGPNRLIYDIPLSLGEIRLLPLAGIVHLCRLHTSAEAPRLPLYAVPPVLILSQRAREVFGARPRRRLLWSVRSGRRTAAFRSARG